MKVSELMNPKGVLLYAKIDNSADALGILVELQRIMTIMTACCQSFPAMNWKNTRKRQPSRQRQQWNILRRILYTRSAVP